jgi:hypothetical protein
MIGVAGSHGRLSVALAHRLQLRQGQSLVMTPQLQQAIKLLQLSNVELAEYVETEIERNPLLTRAENEGPDGEAPEQASEKREEMRLDESDGADKASRDSMPARTTSTRMTAHPKPLMAAPSVARRRNSTGPRPVRASSVRKISISSPSRPRKNPFATTSRTSFSLPASRC